MKVLHIIPLLMRSVGFRGIAVWVTLSATVAAVGLFTARAMTLAPDQLAARYLGAASARIEPFGDETAPQKAGVYPAVADWSSAPGVEVSFWGMVDLRSGEGFTRVQYHELPMPAPALTGALELVEGAWPARKGECLVQSVDVDLEPAVGRWPLQFVGKAKEVYEPPSPGLWCAPGTWGAWEANSDGARGDASLTASYYLTMGDESAARFVQELVDKGAVGPAEVLLRSYLLQDRGTTPQSFLAMVSIAVALLTGLPFVMSSIVGSWVRRVQKAMSLAGVHPRLWFRAGVVALLVANVTCAVLGTLVGSLLVLAARPLLRQINGGVPLSPWSLDAGWIGPSAALAGVGALAGFVLTSWAYHLRMRASVAVARPLTVRGSRTYCLVGCLLAVLSLALISCSQGRLWDMTGGVLVGVLAAAALAPFALGLVSRRLCRGTPSPATLAGRLLDADGRRWAATMATTTVLVGLVLSVLVNVSASAAAQSALLRSPIPQGVVVIEMPEDKSDKDLLERMLTETKAPRPVMAVRSQSLVEGQGNVVLFASTRDALAALGSLPSEATEALQAGGIVKPEAVNGSATVTAGPKSWEVTVTGFRPADGHYLNLGYGYALATQFAGGPEGTELLLLLNVTESQESALRDWPREQGSSSLSTIFHRVPDSATIPMWLSVGFALLALLMGPVIFGIIRREVHQLKPLARDLDSLGVPRSWIRNALRTLTLVAVAIPLTLATLAGAATTAVLQWFYPPIFDTSSANWLGVAVFGVALLAAAVVAAHLGVRNLRRSPPTDTI